MELLFEKQDAMLNATSIEIVRSFISHVNGNAPMLCIREPQGVGKFFDQIADLPNSYMLADDIESLRRNKLPFGCWE